jgi:hypothetical protein
LDETYQNYLNRVARLTIPETYQSQIQNIQESPKFQRGTDGQWSAVPFPGYTVMTPPGHEEAGNIPLYENLQACQQQLLQPLGSDLLVPVPARSFHVTLADLIWDSAFQHAVDADPGFEIQLRSAIAEIFLQHQSLSEGQPLRLQILGLMLMPRALTICLVPTEEHSYHRLTQLRRAVYQDPQLMALGIEQRYGFTAHITLGYFGSISPDLDHEKVCDSLATTNQQWLETPQVLVVHQAQLCKFDDMTHYYREADWPIVQF